MRISPPSSHWSSASALCRRGARVEGAARGAAWPRECQRHRRPGTASSRKRRRIVRVLAQPLWMGSVYWWWSDAHERARDTNRASLQRAKELGDESSAPYVLILLGFIEATIGDYEAALRDALEGQELARQSGQPMPLAYNLAVESLVHAESRAPRGRPLGGGACARARPADGRASSRAHRALGARSSRALSRASAARRGLSRVHGRLRASGAIR